MKKLGIVDLPDEMLAEILKQLDVQSRVRCESVCRKFRNVASLTYASHPWQGISSKKITLVISAWCRFSDVLSDIKNVKMDGDMTKITVLNRGKEEIGAKRRQEWFAQLLGSILVKFISYVSTLEIHNAELNSDALAVLLKNHENIDTLKILGCKFNCAKASDVARFTSAYGAKLVVTKKCSCNAPSAFNRGNHGGGTDRP